jgi:hypothetical protein
MRGSHRLLVLSTLAVPALVAGLMIPSVAYAKGPKAPKPVKVTCTSLGGNPITNTPPPNVGGCNQPAATGGSGTFSGFTGGTGTITVTWNGTGTTKARYSSTEPASKGNKCPTGSTEVILHGAVAPGGVPVSPSPGVKGALHTKLCLSSTGDLSLLHGQVFKI